MDLEALRQTQFREKFRHHSSRRKASKIVAIADRNSTIARAAFASVLALGATSFAAGFAFERDIFGFVGLGSLALSVVLWQLRKRATERASKARFVHGLVLEFMDDIAPGSRFDLRWDTSSSTAGDKIYKTGTSTHGNLKRYHRDDWLRARGVLADGSRLDIRCRRLTKTKKGAVQKLRRYARIRLEPNAARYGHLDAEAYGQLRVAVRDAIHGVFSNPLEELHVKARDRRGAIDIVLEQWDVEIRPDELSHAVGAIVEFLDGLRGGASPNKQTSSYEEQVNVGDGVW